MITNRGQRIRLPMVHIFLTPEDALWLANHIEKRLGWDSDPERVLPESRILNAIVDPNS
jgi:hypothetical protein